MNKLTNIKSRALRQTSVFMVILLLVCWMGTGLAQESKVELDVLIKETLKVSKKLGEATVVWWIPEEFWRVSFAQDPRVPENQTEEFIEILRPYTLIFVMDGKMDTFGAITFRSETDIRASIRIKDSKGTRYPPLAEDEIDADVKNFLSMMKPLLANMAGPMGKNMHFLLFPAKNKKGENIVEAKKKGTFLVELGKREFKWKLPLSSLLPSKICPKCKEKCSGTWNFCPWCGTKLPK